MGTSTAPKPRDREAAYLHELAQEALAARDAEAQILNAAEAAREAREAKNMKLAIAVQKHRKARFAAVGRCEAAAKAFTEAVAEVIKAAGQERAAMTELSGPHADTLADVSINRRLSRYLSHQLRQLSGPTATRFGEIQLCNYFRANLSWQDAERRIAAALPGHEGNGAVDD